MTDFDDALSTLIEQTKTLKPVSVTGTLADIVYTISTGCDALDIQLNGGLPGGRVIEIYGPTSSGKTLIALQAIKSCQDQGGIALLLDVEGTTDSDFMQKLGIRLDRVYAKNPHSIEEIRQEIDEFASYKARLEESLKAESLIAKDQFLPALIVWDSVAATTSQAASDKVEKEGLDAYNVASQARQLSALFRDGQLSSKLNRAGITLFVINQQREKIGVLWGDNKVTFGGKALEYYTSARIELKERAPLVLNKEQVGVMVRSKVTKSKVGSPFGEARLCILFNKGIHNSLTTFYTLDDLGAIGTSGSWLVLKLGDEEYKFRRSEFDTVINDHYTEVIELLKTYGPNRKGVEIPEAVVEEEDDSYTD